MTHSSLKYETQYFLWNWKGIIQVNKRVVQFLESIIFSGVGWNLVRAVVSDIFYTGRVLC